MSEMSSRHVGRVERSEPHQNARWWWGSLRSTHPTVLALASLVLLAAVPRDCPAAIGNAIARAQPAMVKIYGAGGRRGLEPYQSGILISTDGHILTVFSYVLDTDAVTATLADGRRFDARLVGADPRLEVAVLKIDAADLPHFELAKAVDLEPPAWVLALSNLFNVAGGNEPASVQHGVVSVKTQLDAGRGAFKTPYRGPVYVLDAVTNNPGAAGGALVDTDGRLAAMLGKELQNAENGTWLNYAVPIAEIRPAVERILADEASEKRVGPIFADTKIGTVPDKPAHGWDLATLGVVLVPDVTRWTPPYVDAVRPATPAAGAGLRPDDLVVVVGDRLVRSSKELQAELRQIDRDSPLPLTIQRGEELSDLEVRSPK